MTDPTRYPTGPLGKQLRPKVIELRHLTLASRGQPHLYDISLDVFAGEAVALIGPPRAGKSTLLACIQGQIKAPEGSIRVLGKQPLSALPEIRQQVGVMTQDFEGQTDETVAAYLQRCAQYHAHALTSAQVQEYCQHYQLAPTLSIGALTPLQTQIVALAAGLIHDPCLVLLDDPLGGLSLEESTHFWTYLQRTQREGRTMFCTFTSPLANHSLSGYDQIVFLEQGRLSSPGA